jgi:hypothetical protein
MKTKTNAHSDGSLIDQLGGSTELAKRLGMTKKGSVQRVQNWKKRGIPLAVKVEHAELFLPSLLALSASFVKQMEK